MALERSKRLTSSIFGRVINRKENIYPKAILDTITKTIEDACKDKGFYLQMTSAGPKFKVKHQYFYQCQGIMNIIGLPFIDFVVFTMHDFHVGRIHCD